MDSSDEELEPLSFSFKKNKKNNKKNKNTTSSYNNNDNKDDDSSDELAFQCAILSSLEKTDTKQKSPVHSPSLIPISFPLYTKTEPGSTSSPSTCVICLEVVPFGTPGIVPCRHMACPECLTGYVAEQVKDDARQVACPGKNCVTVFNVRCIATVLERGIRACVVPKEVYHRWNLAIIEGSVLQQTMFVRCPLEGCRRQFVDDERGYMIRACTCCWRLLCCECMSACHIGMTCDQFKKREREAFCRRTLIVRRREEEERERKRKRWCKENNHVEDDEDDILQILRRIAAQFPDLGDKFKNVIVFKPSSSDDTK